MPKHKGDKQSQQKLDLHNKAGRTPQAPAAGQNQQNQYR
jgi:hypothetical protein